MRCDAPVGARSISVAFAVDVDVRGRHADHELLILICGRTRAVRRISAVQCEHMPDMIVALSIR
jgi:hypothetical protein